MSTASPSSDANDPLQFDQAEFTKEAPAGVVCATCKSLIVDRYYEVNGHIVCESCRGRIEQTWTGGSKVGRVVKASILGFLAAIVGAIGYYAITKMTGYNLGLVSVVVGVMIGMAVKAGSGGRGGLGYQLLAVGLTYTSIAIMLIPMVLEGLQERREAEEKQQTEQIQKVLDDAIAKHEAESKDAPKSDEAPGTTDAPKVEEPKTAEAPKAENLTEKPVAEAAPPAAEGPTEVIVEEDEEDDAPSAPRLVMIAMLLGLAFSLPVIVGSSAPISGLIYGFALWEAWKINRPTALAMFNGPYKVERPAAVAPEVVIEDNPHRDDGHGA
ncbi:LIM domain-containing protein [Paludisphaera rhizosphaerae]|uniref:hypothetical protein n=1 Tax=Paludisphaera rhizosphaerae TaxID=2711216 RepID=UPI0013EA8B44|nr:hypothetical protein [Paludisphaera rhizosphaerae]